MHTNLCSSIGLQIVVFCGIVSCLLDDIEYSDLMAVKTRLEDEKAKRLLLQNDVEVLMMKIAGLERQMGVQDDAMPMVMAANIERNENKIQKIDEILDRLQTTVAAGQGSVYIRWGRTECPGNGTEFIYKGFAAGSHYSEKGAAANSVCLPEDPIWNNYLDGLQSNSARMYGVEYEFDQRNRASFFGQEIHDADAPCAVCRSPRATSLMIPGRNACYNGWNLEYSGYLAAGYHGHPAATEFICLDEEPEVPNGGSKNENGNVWYFVEPICGSLRCPPYVEGRELTCCVCTK